MADASQRPSRTRGVAHYPEQHQSLPIICVFEIRALFRDNRSDYLDLIPYRAASAIGDPLGASRLTARR